MVLQARTEELSLALNAEHYDQHVQVLRPYGVGIDCHQNFVQVCVLRQTPEGKVQRTEREFTTDWPALRDAQRFILENLACLDDPPNERTLRYCLESTGSYHIPVLLALEGRPAIVNPLLATPSRRKTDVLDARLLANHSITGMWPESFVPNEDVQL